MNKRFRLSLALVLLVIISSFSFATTDDSKTEVLQPTAIDIGSKTHNVYITWVDLNDPTIKVELSLANDKIGAVDTLKNLSQPDNADEQVIASINGSFFNMRPDSQPVSTLITDGNIQHIMHTGSVVGFDDQNKMYIEKLGIKLEGSINDQWEWPYSWSAWNINHLFNSESAIMVFNNYYTGSFPTAPVYAVAIEHNEVIGIYDHVPAIPQNGYIIVTRNSNITHLFNMGDKVDFRLRTYERDSSQQLTDVAVPFKDIRTAVGAGPTLVKDGLKALDPVGEGFTISKLMTTTAKRSMVGATADGKMALVVTQGSVTLSDLADIALKLGLNQAVNLDGGGSSGLMVNGNYAVTPGRKISNALVVKKLKTQPVRLNLNDMALYFDVEPYIESGRVMVPLRRILEMQGCQVKWLNETRQIQVNRYGTTLLFKTGEETVVVDGKNYQMDVPLVIKNGRSFVPVRFLTEFFGGTVEWLGDQKLVELNLPTVEEYYNTAEAYFRRGAYETALEYYNKVLKMHDKHVSAIKRTAYIYEMVLGDHRSALDYYKRALTIFDQDSDTYIQLGDAYRLANALPEALDAYQKALAIKANAEGAYYGLAKCYEFTDVDKAVEYFTWVYQNAKNYDRKDEARSYLEQHTKAQ